MLNKSDATSDTICPTSPGEGVVPSNDIETIRGRCVPSLDHVGVGGDTQDGQDVEHLS